MQPTFMPPANEGEFQERAAKLTRTGAESILNSLRQRRTALVKSIDQEIAFYERVIRVKDRDHYRGGEED